MYTKQRCFLNVRLGIIVTGSEDGAQHIIW